MKSLRTRNVVYRMTDVLVEWLVTSNLRKEVISYLYS